MNINDELERMADECLATIGLLSDYPQAATALKARILAFGQRVRDDERAALHAVVEHLKRVADYSCDLMEGAELGEFKVQEGIMLAAIDFLRTAGIEYNPITGAQNSKEVMKTETKTPIRLPMSAMQTGNIATGAVIPGAGASDDKHASGADPAKRIAEIRERVGEIYNLKLHTNVVWLLSRVTALEAELKAERAGFPLEQPLHDVPMDRQIVLLNRQVKSVEAKLAEAVNLISAYRYAVEFYPHDNGYRARSLVNGTSTGKELATELSTLRRQVEEALEFYSKQDKWTEVLAEDGSTFSGMAFEDEDTNGQPWLIADTALQQLATWKEKG